MRGGELGPRQHSLNEPKILIHCGLAGGFALQQASARYGVQADSTGTPGISIPLYNGIFYLGEGKCSPNQLFCGTGAGEDRARSPIPAISPER